MPRAVLRAAPDCRRPPCARGSLRTSPIQKRPARSQELLSGLTSYISLRYNGEEWLALEALECVAAGISGEIEFRRGQYRAQVEWCAKAMGLRRVDETRFTRDDERTDQK